MGVSTFTQENVIIPLCAISADGTSNLELDSVDMSLYEQLTVIIQFSATLTGVNVLTAECGATDGADTSDATFHYRYGGAVAGTALCDVLSADATSAALSLTAATYQGRIIVCELHQDELPKSGETVYNHVQFDLDGTASACTVAAIAILSKPRYAKAIMPAALSA